MVWVYMHLEEKKNMWARLLPQESDGDGGAGEKNERKTEAEMVG